MADANVVFFPHQFTLHLRLPPGADVDALIDALFEAGCNDALIGCGRPGYLALAFTREAPSFDAALQSATTDALRAIPGALVVQAPEGAPRLRWRGAASEPGTARSSVFRARVAQLASDHGIDDALAQRFAEKVAQECAAHLEAYARDWEAQFRLVFDDQSGFMSADVRQLLTDYMAGISD